MVTHKLSREELHYAMVMFKLRVHECDGQAYEDLFVSVIGKRYPRFKPVKPHGNTGDRKNDGYIADTGSYFQVYAPENASRNIVHAIEKAKVDFEGLKAYWEKIAPLKEFRFVLNDKFNGPYPEVEKALSEIGKANDLKVCECMLAKHLMEEFLLLDEQGIMQVVGLLPAPESLRNLDFSVFAEVIRHVIANPISLNAIAVLRVPDFDEKLQFNAISSAVGALITRASFQAGAVLTFFQRNATVSKKAIRDKLADIYLHQRDTVAKTALNGSQQGDSIFFGMLKEIVPSESVAAQDAAIVLMAHFFESCDIYDDPNLFT